MATPVVELVAIPVEAKKNEKVVKWLGHYSSAYFVATSLDSYVHLISKYSKAGSNVAELKRLGATVLHSVSVKSMKKRADLKSKRLDRIVFNFPHAGFIGEENQVHMIKAHQLLVRRFFRNASHLIRTGGEVHVSHKTTTRHSSLHRRLPTLSAQ